MPAPLAIATILYHPESATFDRLAAAAARGCAVYVFDNTPDAMLRAYLERNHREVRYFTAGKNIGIGPALRLLAATAYHEGHAHLLYFDQDTVFTDETLEFIEGARAVFAAHGASEQTPVLSITFRDAGRRSPEQARYAAVHFGYTVLPVNLTISSGSLFSLDQLSRLGWHDASYRVDGVDYRLCLSAEAAGLALFEICGTPGLDHRSDQGDASYRFAGRTFAARKYPARRIVDFCWSTSRLLIASIRLRSTNGWFLARSLAIYLAVQLYVRVGRPKASAADRG